MITSSTAWQFGKRLVLLHSEIPSPSSSFPSFPVLDILQMSVHGLMRHEGTNLSRTLLEMLYSIPSRKGLSREQFDRTTQLTRIRRIPPGYDRRAAFVGAGAFILIRLSGAVPQRDEPQRISGRKFFRILSDGSIKWRVVRGSVREDRQ